ncbi:endonuclease/exonuclease/phosphatase family protein [Phaeobacter sp. JH20_36]|uniref:endonuclease/exonuclease/phosphatase family protein n=1 Tax=unclassified Phaeobacter TaxID=2621772 RepID=UPI003A88B0AA
MSRFILFLAGLWLVLAAAHEIFTGRAWVWVIPGVSPPLMFAALPVLFLAVAPFLKRHRAAVAGLAIVTFTVSLPSTGFNFAALWHAPAPRSEGLPIKVVQLNTDYWGQMRDGTLTDPHDKDAMLAYLRALDADVYLLQEHMTRVGDTAPPVTDLSDVAEIFPEYEARTAGTLLTLSRLPIKAHKIVTSDARRILQLPPPPYVLKVDVELEGAVVSTYNVHMPIQIIIEQDWFSAAFYNEIKRRHAIRQQEFAALTADVRSNPKPLVIAGDFNTSPAIGDNRKLLKATRDAVSYTSIVYPATWRVGGQLPKLWRNDWFLVGNAIKVADFWQLDPEGNSDHLGQAVNLRVTAARIDARPFSVLEGEE